MEQMQQLDCFHRLLTTQYCRVQYHICHPQECIAQAFQGNWQQSLLTFQVSHACQLVCCAKKYCKTPMAPQIGAVMHQPNIAQIHRFVMAFLDIRNVQ